MSAPSIMAIVSRAVFDKQAPKAAVGQVLPFDRYTSGNKALEPLGRGGRLFLFTVRPEGEALWLVAVLEQLTFQGDAWVAAAPNRVPATDISSLKGQIKFESGKGITAKAGALGMSLQTPRALAESDVALILALAGGAAPAAPSAPVVPDASAELIKAILVAPESNGPRLVYADWLQEKGDPRGEFITTQVSLGGELEFPSRRIELKRRERELLAEHRERWAAPVKEWAGQYTFRRGFLDEIRADAASLVAHGAEVLGREPVMRLWVDEVGKKEASALASAPWMSVVRRLRLRGDLGDAGVSALAGSSHLAALVSLNLGSCGLGAKAMTALGKARLMGLRALSLSGNPIGDRGVSGLLATPLLSGCQRLYLARCGLTDAGVKLLAQAPQFGLLTGLCLGNNEVTDEAAKALAESPHLRGLKRLELDENELSPKGREVLEKRFGKRLKLAYGHPGEGEGGGDDEDGDDE